MNGSLNEILTTCCTEVEAVQWHPE